MSEQFTRAAARVVEANGFSFNPGSLSGLVRRAFRRGGLDAAAYACTHWIERRYGIRSPGRSYLRAVSLECADNPYVARWLVKVSGGLPA